MVENRNSCFGNPSSQSRETICIDTYRVLDSCRDRDCYEDARVYLTEAGQEMTAADIEHYFGESGIKEYVIAEKVNELLINNCTISYE